jgi:hypothetical protein
VDIQRHTKPLRRNRLLKNNKMNDKPNKLILQILGIEVNLYNFTWIRFVQRNYNFRQSHKLRNDG